MDILHMIFAFVLSILSMVFPAFNVESEAPDTYARFAIVFDVEPENNTVIFADDTENLWDLQEDIPYEIDDEVILFMDSKGTPCIYDDEIIGVAYGRYTLGFPVAYADYSDFDNLHCEFIE